MNSSRLCDKKMQSVSAFLLKRQIVKFILMFIVFLFVFRWSLALNGDKFVTKHVCALSNIAAYFKNDETP